MPDGVIDAAAAASALGLGAVVSQTRLAGFDATVWRAELDGGGTVALRVLRTGVDAGREVRALRAARDHTDLAPRLLGVGELDGHAVLALSWCAGTPVGDLVPALDPELLGIEFGRAQRALHRPVDGAVLCHLDYQPFNVLADAACGTVTGVVDWANARYDDVRADLAWTSVVLEFGPALIPSLAPAMPTFSRGWRTGYGDVPADDQLRPYLAAAARRQLAEWSSRHACPPAALAAAGEIARRYAS